MVLWRHPPTRSRWALLFLAALLAGAPQARALAEVAEALSPAEAAEGWQPWTEEEQHEEEDEAPSDPGGLKVASAAPGERPLHLSAPPLLRVAQGEVVDLGALYHSRYRFRMNMAYGAAGVTAAGILPFSAAVALHEIWPCGGRDCISVTTAMGLFGLGGLSLFLIGAGAMAHWSTVAAHALYDPKAPAGAIWMGRTAFVLWAISEVLLTLAIVGPGAGLFWAGTLFGFFSIPFAIGQMVSTTLRRRDRDPGTRIAGWPVAPVPLAQWRLAP
ncbi:MAG: hypothetical protein P1V51_20710 [Deltaproteobacteria bacterium]|nr:hypothetical protein [Deltaproteobacteria bacterium]